MNNLANKVSIQQKYYLLRNISHPMSQNHLMFMLIQKLLIQIIKMLKNLPSKFHHLNQRNIKLQLKMKKLLIKTNYIILKKSKVCQEHKKRESKNKENNKNSKILIEYWVRSRISSIKTMERKINPFKIQCWKALKMNQNF